MKFRGTLALILLLIAVFWLRSKQRTSSDADGPETAEIHPPILAPTSVKSRLVQTQVSESKSTSITKESLARVTVSPGKPEDPYQVDPFSIRQLDKPWPKSIKDLLTHRTPYEDAKLPETVPGRDNGYDGDVLTTFDGYIMAVTGELQALRVSHDTGGIRIALGEISADPQEWSSDLGTLKLENYADDPYGLVLTTNTHLIAYLKFYTDLEAAGLPHHARALAGFMLSSTDENAKVGKVILLDSYIVARNAHRDPRDPPIDWKSLVNKYVKGNL